MKSSLKIALGLGNEPIISFNVVPSDDIRDQLCCQFLHKLGGTSNTCHVSVRGNSDVGLPITHILEISPIAPIMEGHGGWSDQLEFITSLHAIEHTIREQRNLGWVSFHVGGTTVYWMNSKTTPRTFSPEYNRRELSLLHRDELVRRVISILDDVENWKPLVTPQKS